MSTLSLLYPPQYTPDRVNDSPDLTFYSQLGLERLVQVPVKGTVPWEVEHQQFSRLFTSDPAVIQYRLDVVEDLVNNPEICSTFADLLPQIETIAELRADKSRVSDTTSCLYSISEIELYTDCIDTLHQTFSHKAKIQSAGLRSLAQVVADVYNSDEYQNLKSNAAKLMEQTRSIRSITIGVNLDAQLHAVEAGVVAVNSEYYRSGDIIDRILRLDRKDDGFRCLTPLIPYGKNRSDQQATAFNMAINTAIDIVFAAAVRSWRPIIRRYLALKTDFIIALAKEMRLLLGAVELIKKLRELGLPMCKPQVCDQQARVFEVKGLYNPHIALSLGKDRIKDIVFNDFAFDENAMLYILTGANQGGKTAITYAVGITQALFQLGMFVPARSAQLSPVDQILVHFPSSGDSIGKGRLGEECEHLRDIFRCASEHSLVLMDEALSSTSAVEASYIAGEVLLSLSLIGARGIFATHLHDLAQRVDEINSYGGNKSKLDNLVAEVSMDEDGARRTYKIRRTKPDGLSYAKSIAQKYGITLDQIMRERRIRKDRT